jgi:protein gp37
MRYSVIEWCHHTFCPWCGCRKIPGVNGAPSACDNCYAWLRDKRHLYNPFEHWDDAPRMMQSYQYWQQPLAWNRVAKVTGRAQVFCGSMCDVMERLRPDHPSYKDVTEARTRLFRLIEQTPYLDWMLLTKRPNEFEHFLPKSWLENPRHNVWLMTTVESSANLFRIDYLMKVPAVVHAVSCEPLFDQIILPEYFLKSPRAWVITGGETGYKSVIRRHQPDWFRSLRNQAVSAGAFFHFKQWGNLNSDLVFIKDKHDAGRELDGRTWDERPVEGMKPGMAAEEWAKYLIM